MTDPRDAVIEGLTKALEPFADASKGFDDAALHFQPDVAPDDTCPWVRFTHGQLRAARAALATASKLKEEKHDTEL